MVSGFGLAKSRLLHLLVTQQGGSTGRDWVSCGDVRAAACVAAGAWNSPLATAKALRTVVLQSHGGETVSYKYVTYLVRFEFLAVVTMKTADVWAVS
jgi:hypothetical protein